MIDRRIIKKLNAQGAEIGLLKAQLKKTEEEFKIYKESLDKELDTKIKAKLKEAIDANPNTK